MHPTRRQKLILEALRELTVAGGPPPTLAAIAKRCGIRSVSAVHKHLAKLRERGLIQPVYGAAAPALTAPRGAVRRGARGVVPVPGALAAASVSVPLLGTIAAGRPIEAIEDREEIGIPADMARGASTFVLRVRGDSMEDEQILDGDYVVVEKRSTARDGETVVALIDGREATLKKLRRRRGLVELVPANENMQPIQVRPEAMQIQGIVTGLIRAYGRS